MIKSIVKVNLDKFTSNKLIVVALVFIIYSIQIKKTALSQSVSYWEYFILTLGDHYYSLFFLILSFIFLIFNVFKEDSELVWIRSDSYLRYFLSNIFSMLCISGTIVMLHVLIAAIMGYGLSLDNNFTGISNDQRHIINYFTPYFSSPIEASLGIIFYMIFGLTFLGIVFLFLKHFFKNIVVVFCLAIIYVLTVLSIKSDVDLLLPYIFINNYIILHHSFVVLEEKFYHLLIAGGIVISCIVLMIKNYWNYSISNFKKTSLFFDKWNLNNLLSYKNLVLLTSLITFMSLSTTLKVNEEITFIDLILLQFYGHGTSYFYYLDFLKMVVYNGVPIYLLCYFIERESVQKSSLLLIRLEYKKVWLHSLMRSSFIYLLSYVGVTIIFLLMLSLFLGLPLNGVDYIQETYNIYNVNSYSVIFITIALKVLELFFYFLSILFLYSLSKNMTLSFLSISFGYMLCVLNITVVKYIPFGISSLSRIKEYFGDGLSYSTSLVLLTLSCTIMFSVIRKITYLKIFE